MVNEGDVFVGVSYTAKLQYEELKKVIDRASDSFNRFKTDSDKYESLLSNLSSDLKSIHESFEKIFNDLNKSSVENQS
ncbi:MAG: hypothetical protein OH338_03530 [Candidatus Parvarchaeota archaeon]|nr:hypothetical protein [Candidatus Parvarchaeota archaeon]MCW1294705.1 hypothetical protein [Candidatus Parvarchaeum tengchongense]MCW1295121.1 hypothetical protein [Candidatus Parvarchaeum tengchongense]MCW1312473.1 hypothetical protein [Candidatus Parvarchaeum tengchongense]